jgi:hypothetical protein
MLRFRTGPEQISGAPTSYSSRLAPNRAPCDIGILFSPWAIPESRSETIVPAGHSCRGITHHDGRVMIPDSNRTYLAGKPSNSICLSLSNPMRQLIEVLPLELLRKTL